VAPSSSSSADVLNYLRASPTAGVPQWTGALSAPQVVSRPSAELTSRADDNDDEEAAVARLRREKRAARHSYDDEGRDSTSAYNAFQRVQDDRNVR
jgi:hypothetical protein